MMRQGTDLSARLRARAGRPAIAAALSLLFLGAPSAWGQSPAGLVRAGSSSADGRVWERFEAPRGLAVLVAPVARDAEADARLAAAAAAIDAWTRIRAVELRAELGPEADSYVVVVGGVELPGFDASRSLPGGIGLRYEGALFYDFRLRSGAFFVRVRGLYTGERDLLREMAEAAADPARYIAERDPAQAARRLGEAESVMAGLEAAASAQAAATEALRRALASEMNRGLFGGPRPLAAATLDAAKELKAAEPALDRRGMAAALKARGLNAAAKELDIVFRVWFEQ